MSLNVASFLSGTFKSLLVFTAVFLFSESVALADDAKPQDPAKVAGSLERLGALLSGGSSAESSNLDSHKSVADGELRAETTLSNELPKEALAPPSPADQEFNPPQLDTIKAVQAAEGFDGATQGDRPSPAQISNAVTSALNSRVDNKMDGADPLANATQASTKGNSVAEQLAISDRYEKARAAANAGNFTQARKIFELLAQLDHPDSQYSLGRMYARGDGVKKDFPTARKYFEQAAAHNHGRALYSLGIMARNGDGQLVNQEKALAYFEKALAAGCEDARPAIRELKR